MTPLHLAAALLMVTIWGFNFVVIRWGLNDIPPLLLTLLRFILAAFPAMLFVKPTKGAGRLIVGYGLFAFALQFSLLFAGMAAGMPTGLASLVIQVQAFFTIGLVALLMHERPRPAAIGGCNRCGARVWCWWRCICRRHGPGFRSGRVAACPGRSPTSSSSACRAMRRSRSSSGAAQPPCVPLAVATLAIEGLARSVAGRQRAFGGALARHCLPGLADDAGCVRHLGLAAAPASGRNWSRRSRCWCRWSE